MCSLAGKYCSFTQMFSQTHISLTFPSLVTQSNTYRCFLKFYIRIVCVLNGYWYLTVVRIGFTGKHWKDGCWSEWFSTPPAVAAAEAIRDSGPWSRHLACRADEGRPTAPETLCRSLAPPTPRTTQGNPPADAPWTVIEVSTLTTWTLFLTFSTLKVDCKLLTLFDSVSSMVQPCHTAKYLQENQQPSQEAAGCGVDLPNTSRKVSE